MALPPVLNKIVDWLRAGYPDGVPNVDYIPLFALLGSQLTETETCKNTQAAAGDAMTTVQGNDG